MSKKELKAKIREKVMTKTQERPPVKTKVFFPPTEPSWDWDIKKYKSVFLAGSIEMNKAEDWQTEVTKALKNENIIFLNPRRKDWDNDWKQEITDKNFKGQVMWELTQLDSSDMIAMYFDPTTKSPISLLELGLYASKGKLVVCCPKGFWRKGNVDIVCEKYQINQVDSLKDLIEYIKKN